MDKSLLVKRVRWQAALVENLCQRFNYVQGESFRSSFWELKGPVTEDEHIALRSAAATLRLRAMQVEGGK